MEDSPAVQGGQEEAVGVTVEVVASAGVSPSSSRTSPLAPGVPFLLS